MNRFGCSMKLAGEARHRLQKKTRGFRQGARNGLARDEKYTQVIRAPWTARAFRPSRSIQYDFRFEEAKFGRRKKRKGRRRRENGGCTLINISYKNAGVHNLHEPKTESKNRYPFLFLLFFSLLVRFLTMIYRSLSLSVPFSFSLSLPTLLSPGNAEHNG